MTREFIELDMSRSNSLNNVLHPFELDTTKCFRQKQASGRQRTPPFHAGVKSSPAATLPNRRRRNWGWSFALRPRSCHFPLTKSYKMPPRNCSLHRLPLLLLSSFFVIWSQLCHGVEGNLYSAIVFEAWNATEGLANLDLTLLSDTAPVIDCSAGPLNVQVLISSCFDTTKVTAIETWVKEQLIDTSSTMYVGNNAITINYGVKFVRPTGSSCADPSVLQTSLSYLTAKDFGVSPDAAIAFVSDDEDLIGGVDAKYELQFRVCTTTSLAAACTATTTTDQRLQKLEELYQFNARHISLLFPCTATTNAVAIPYLGTGGVVTCTCACPSGTVLSDNACKSSPLGGGVVTGDGICPWDAESAACVFSDSTSKSSLKLVDHCNLPVIVPTDNYVADGRVNANDNELDDPVVEVMVTKIDSQDAPKKMTETWQSYTSDPKAALNSFAITSAGAYSIEISASDYSSSASCKTCVEVHNEVRPSFSSDCPTAFLGSTNTQPAVFSPTTASAAAANEQAFVQFYQDTLANVPTDSRCDITANTRRNYYATTLDAYEGTCFDASSFGKDILDVAASKTNPVKGSNGIAVSTLTADLQASLQLQCMQCCQKTVALAEKTTRYSCVPGTSPTEECIPTGDSARGKCSFQHCVVIKGDSYFEAATAIKASEQTKSQDVAKALPTVPTFNAAVELHRTIACNDFNSGCSFKADLSSIFDATMDWGSNAPSVPSNYNAKDYIFWRYKMTEGSWTLWDPTTSTQVSFASPSTSLTIEAWSQCGLVNSAVYTVILHAQSSSVCDKFAKTFYQTTDAAVSRSNPSQMCTYPGSDFAVVTFDFDRDLVMSQAENTVKGTLVNVDCNVQVGAVGANFASEVQAAKLLTVDLTMTTRIVQHFGVVMVSNPSTVSVATAANTTCVFTYQPYGIAATDSANFIKYSCPYVFTVSDCDKPRVVGASDVCAAGTCAASPGPYKACGGAVFSSAPATAVGTIKTITKPRDGAETCCSDCNSGVTLNCNAILGLPIASQDVKRCEPTTKSALLAAGQDGIAATRFSAMETSAIMAVIGMTTALALAAIHYRQRVADDSKSNAIDFYYSIVE